MFFDLDDTLCAYWEAARTGLRRSFELHGPIGFMPEKMEQHWAAAFRTYVKQIKNPEWYGEYLKSGEITRTEQMRRTLLEIGIVDEDRAVALSKSYMQERDRALRLFDDALPLLDALKKTYPLGLITNGPADVQRQEIDTLGIAHYFQTILIEGEMGEGKPNQAVFRRAENAVGLKSHEILFVGNSYAHDIQPAIEAGWKTVWVRRDTDVPPSSGGSALEPKPHGSPDPDRTIGELWELLPQL